MIFFCIACVVPNVHASSTKSGATWTITKMVDRCRADIERMIGRPIRSEEWPEILSSKRLDIDIARCPYAYSKARRPTDAWRHPLALREGQGVYSFGADGIDQRGERDDIASWRTPDRRYYLPSPMDLVDLMIPPALLLALFGVPAWLCLRRWNREHEPS